MANKFLIKRGDGAPAQGAIDQYELVYDYTGNQLYTKVGSTITAVGSSTSGSNNQVLTDDGSGGINSEGSLLFSGSTLEINNTGDWSYIKNNTNSGGLRLGTKDSGGTFASQIEISNTGNYVKLNENTTVTGKVQASGKLKSTMTGGFTIGNVAGEDRIQNSSNSFSFLTDGNAYANMTFGTVTAGTWQGTAVAAAYVGNLPASKITSGAFDIDRLPTKDEDNMSSNSADHLPTQQSVKAYVDANSGGAVSAVANGADNRIATFSSSTALNGESELTYTGGELKVNRSGSVTNKVTITGGSTAVLDLNSTGDSFIEKDTGNTLYIANNSQDKNIYFRVNDGGSNNVALAINGSTSRVGINETSVDANLHVTGSPVVLKLERPGQRAIRMGTPDNSSQFIIADSDDLKSNQRYIIDGSGNHSIYGNTSFSSPMTVQYGATFNEGGHNSDFRVESQNQTHQLHVDASADIVKTVNLRDDRTHIGYTVGHGLEPNQMSIQDWCDLPTGFHGMMRSGNQSYGNPGSTYFYFHKLSQRDSGGGWGGIALGYASNAEFYVGHTQTNSSYATWSKVWNQANDGSGSGLDADLLDGVHASGFWQNSGTWNGANFSGSRHRGLTINGGEISIQRDHPNNGQVSVLVDGGYSAGENNGFWSLYSGNSWNNRVGFGSDSSGNMKFNSTHATGGYWFANQGTTRIQMTYDGQIKWGNGAAHGTLTWDTGKAIITSQGSNNLEIRRVNSSDMIDLEENEIRFVADGTERMAVNQNGLDLGGSTANKIVHNAHSSRDKIRVWTSSNYAIGMQSGFTFGGLENQYAMTFQMNNQSTERGFWWGDDGHGQGNGAMALTTAGELTVADSMRLGYGESDTTTPGSTFTMDLYGANGLKINTTGDQQLRFVRSGGNDISIEHDASQIYFYNRATSKAMFLMSNNGSARLGHNSNPSLELRNTATGTGSGPSLVFGHDQSGTNSVARISSYLVDGSQASRAGHLRFWTRRSGTEELAMQLQHDKKLRLYQQGDTTDYLEIFVDDSRAHYHHAHTGSSGAYHRFITDNGYIELGPSNTGWGHIQTDRSKFYFNKQITVDSGIITAYDEDLSLRRASDSSADRIDIAADYTRVIVNNNEEFRVDGSGTLTSGQARVTSEFQVNSNGTTLRRYVGTWTSGNQTHDVIYNAYQTNLGDYVYLKASGNSTTTHGMLINSDKYLFWGRDNLITGAVDNSATAPMTDVCMRVDENGNALFDGDVVAYSTTIASDARLKENVKDLNYGLKDVLDIRPVSFDWIDKRDGQHDIGVIAQEIEKIIPEVVVEVDTLNSEDTHKTVDYAKLTSVLIKAVQEQQQQINELKEKLNG